MQADREASRMTQADIARYGHGIPDSADRVEVDFDDVRLDVSLVPLPLSAWMMASALGVLGVLRWRSRARRGLARASAGA